MKSSLKTSNRNRALTVLELLVVMVIFGILVSLLLSGVSSMRANGQQVVCMTHMRQLGEIILRYSAEHNGKLLPAVSGDDAQMNSTAWYYILDAEGMLPGNPKNPINEGKELWGGQRNSIMACPSRPDAPHSVWVGGKGHDLHYCVNQNPGFYNRVNTQAGAWPTLAKVTAPGRTFLLAEATTFVGSPDGKNFVYPHPHRGGDIVNGKGMNLFFFDGHSALLKQRLPVLPGRDQSSVPYDQISPEDSFPFF